MRKEKAPVPKLDPAFLAKARELRDRWMERLNDDGATLLSQGKYYLCRALSSQTAGTVAEPAALPAPMAA